MLGVCFSSLFLNVYEGSLPLCIHSAFSQTASTFTGSVQVGNHCPFPPPHLTWYSRQPFSHWRWYGGGAGPFDHGVSFQFVFQHFEISLPSFFFWPISLFINILSDHVVSTNIHWNRGRYLVMSNDPQRLFSMTLSGIVTGKKPVVIFNLVMFSFWWL